MHVFSHSLLICDLHNRNVAHQNSKRGLKISIDWIRFLGLLSALCSRLIAIKQRFLPIKVLQSKFFVSCHTIYIIKHVNVIYFFVVSYWRYFLLEILNFQVIEIRILFNDFYVQFLIWLFLYFTQDNIVLILKVRIFRFFCSFVKFNWLNNTMYITMCVFTYTWSQKHNSLSDSITM